MKPSGTALALLFCFATNLSADCPPLDPASLPSGLGGVAVPGIGIEQAIRWRRYRQAREQERFLEALDPARVHARYRVIDQDRIEAGCVSIEVLVDVGRALFLRSFTPLEGLGNDLAGRHPPAGNSPRPNRRRLGAGTFGGPEALSCKDCHWRGGMAGAGDRADNVYLGGDGNTLASHEELQAPALWGSAWLELIAAAMSRDLIQQRDQAIQQVRATGAPSRVELNSKGVDFGVLGIRPVQSEAGLTVEIDHQRLYGVSPDLVVRPFGWRGRYSRLREAVIAQLHLHLGLQASELIFKDENDSALSWLDRGSEYWPDPDGDGVMDEITEGQVTALSVYLATLTTPQTRIPKQGPERGAFMTAELGLAPTSEWIHRWGDGARRFEQIGCADCHRPYLEVDQSTWSSGPGSSGVTIDLAAEGAAPQPQAKAGRFAVPVFSDFRRHAMGEYLEQLDPVTQRRSDVYLTRPLWGMASTGPWMHDGRAPTIDAAVALHGGTGSAARSSAERFAVLSEHEKTAVRVFLMSLQRAPAIRVR